MKGGGVDYWEKHDFVAVLQANEFDQLTNHFDLLGMDPEYILSRAESTLGSMVISDNIKHATLDSLVGNTHPDAIYYLDSNSDYTGISGISHRT